MLSKESLEAENTTPLPKPSYSPLIEPPMARHNPLENITKFEKTCLKIACKIPCLIVFTIIFGDLYLTFGYSRVLLFDIVGVPFGSVLLTLFVISLTILVASYKKKIAKKTKTKIKN